MYTIKAIRKDNGQWINGYIWNGASCAYVIPHNLGVNHENNQLMATAYEVHKETICMPIGIDAYWYDNGSGLDTICIEVMDNNRDKTYLFVFGAEIVLTPGSEGMGGAIAKALTFTESEHILVLNGDSFIKFQLQDICLPQAENQSLLVLKEMHNVDRYGSVLLDNNIITAFEEKQYKETALINAGIYILNRNIFNNKSLPEKFSFEKDFLEKEVENKTLLGKVINAYFIDIGIPEDYSRAQIELVNEINN